nr:BTB/POZ domain-containing protein [Colletotrichum truncatum]KAF6800475.1 BTB/POZ domain-containing protein [Colletotrichum truncatum]
MPVLDDHRWLLESKTISDFRIRCENEEIHVHKVMLCLNSRYFVQLFKSEFMEAKEGVVNFPDIGPEPMNHLLDFFYRGTTDWNLAESDLAMNVRVWILADRLQADNAMIEIEYRLSGFLKNFDNKHLVADESLLELVFSHPVCSESVLAYIFAEAAWIHSIDSYLPDTGGDLNIRTAALRHSSLANTMLMWSVHYTYISGQYRCGKRDTSFLRSKVADDMRQQIITV